MERTTIEIESINSVISGIITFIFGIFSLIFGLGLFSFRSILILETYKFLIFISGTIYIISGIFLFRLKKWARKLTIVCSTVLLFYFIPFLIILITDPWGWAQLIVPLCLPYILFPLFFIIFLTRPQIKEKFRKL